MRISGRLLVVSIVIGSVLLGISDAPALAALPGPDETQLLSVTPSGLPGTSESQDAKISADGRYVVFRSDAPDLVATPGRLSQIYLRDTLLGSTVLVSAAGGIPGNGASSSPRISADGGVVVYISSSTNLVGLARSGIPQLFVWSRGAGATSIISISGDVVPSPANGAVTEAAVSGDGTAVAFSTAATNLTGYDTRGHAQIYERTLAAGTTRMVSVDASRPATGASWDALEPAISGDGGFVAFTTKAGLGDAPENGFSQIFRRTIASGGTELVSRNVQSTAAARGDSHSPSISADGNLIAFASTALDLVARQEGPGIYWRDMVGALTGLATPSIASDPPRDTSSFAYPSISADGSSIAFMSSALDLTREREARGDGEIWVRRLREGVTSLVSRASRFADVANAWSSRPAISGNGSLVAFESIANNLVPNANQSHYQIYLRNTAEVPNGSRIGGADRFEVSAAVSAGTFAPRVLVAYVTAGGDFPDALSGSAAAGYSRAPVLLVTQTSIPPSVGRELTRLVPQSIVIVGGPNSVDYSVEDALRAYAPEVTRISGTDRFAVAARVSAATFATLGKSIPVVYVASGAVFPDALSGSAAAGRRGGPVLLVTKDAVPTVVAAELGRLRPQAIVVLGGTNTIGEAVVGELSRIAPTTRIGGTDRFAVSAAISAATFPAGMRTAYVASGSVFPDALSGSAAAIRRAGPVLLVTADSIPAPVRSELARLKPTHIIVLGGAATIGESVLQELQKYAVPPS